MCRCLEYIANDIWWKLGSQQLKYLMSSKQENENIPYRPALVSRSGVIFKFEQGTNKFRLVEGVWIDVEAVRIQQTTEQVIPLGCLIASYAILDHFLHVDLSLKLELISKSENNWTYQQFVEGQFSGTGSLGCTHRPFWYRNLQPDITGDLTKGICEGHLVAFGYFSINPGHVTSETCAI